MHHILRGVEDRLVVIIGPCSVHDPNAAFDYAKRLKCVRQRLKSELEIIMRVYFEKPRTTVGWKGLINDPHMDDSCDMESGLRIARRLLIDINRLALWRKIAFAGATTASFHEAPGRNTIPFAAMGATTSGGKTHLPVRGERGFVVALLAVLEHDRGLRFQDLALGRDDPEMAGKHRFCAEAESSTRAQHFR